MPTVTEYFGIGLTNNGPLTTTYTIHAPRKLHNSNNRPNRLRASRLYHTCPKGWTTAGMFTHGNETGSVKKSGVFTQTASTMPGVPVIDPNMPLKQVWLNALGPSETLAYCCPSGWAAAKAGGCFLSIKPLISATYTEVCLKYRPPSAIRSVYTVEGSKVSQYLYSAVTAEPTSSIWPISVLQTQPNFQYDELAVARRFPAVKLVYKESDLKPTGDGDESNDGANSDDEEKDDDDDNGALSLLRSGGLFSIVAVLFSMLIGAGLVMF
ncbi:hypothetical protein FAGAP_1377 [Fusarium agapanthi]|uniref:Uncharacterized protein n=1 Tax=Fusarium agapanthi TaxID=1803897 RepID=A0A9P5BHT9_9HYPO|nr:hypothetical protein FAGAP_1377 [Fusarium agapanthi]